MRILLGGGAGFLGSHLARRMLGLGHDVLVVDNFITGRWENLAWVRSGPRGDRLDVLAADICALPRLPGPFDAVMHLASPASPRDYLRHPIETLEAGSTGTRLLIGCALDHGARFLLASTSEVYGDPQIHPQPESYWGHVNPVGPRSVYDEAKRYSEALTMAHARRDGLIARIARIFNTYGPCMRLDDGRVIPTFVAQALRDAPITVYGDGSQTRSYCYVEDLVEGLWRLLWSDAEGPVNLGSNEERTVLDTARCVITLTGSRSTIEFRDLPADDPRVRRPDLTRARTLLGWQACVPFDQGLALTVRDLEARLRGAAGDPQARMPPPPGTEQGRNGPTPGNGHPASPHPGEGARLGSGRGLEA